VSRQLTAKNKVLPAEAYFWLKAENGPIPQNVTLGLLEIARNWLVFYRSWLVRNVALCPLYALLASEPCDGSPISAFLHRHGWHRQTCLYVKKWVASCGLRASFEVQKRRPSSGRGRAARR
jgi:hypothetical protein